MNADILKKHGINYEKGVARFMSDAELYESVLEDILNDKAMSSAQKAFESGNMTELEERAHELKGVAGNMEMSELYRSASSLVILLRSKTYTEDDVGELFEKFKKDYETVIAGVKAAMQ